VVCRSVPTPTTTSKAISLSTWERSCSSLCAAVAALQWYAEVHPHLSPHQKP
jgi:hypothetical protein